MKEKQSYVYILTDYGHTGFYTGVTANLEKRMFEHSNEVIESYSSKYNLKKLVYYEIHSDINEAIAREKKIKKWKTGWKWDLIDKVNPLRKDLYVNNSVEPIDNF